MPFRHRHHWVTHLALLAAVLLAGMPTLGRLQQALHATGDAASAAALCTIRGLEYVQLPDASETGIGPQGESDHGGGDHPGHAQDDCAYCPLLSGLLLPPAIASGPPFTPTASDHAWRPSATRPLDTSIPGLGSRGPPTLSAMSS